MGPTLCCYLVVEVLDHAAFPSNKFGKVLGLLCVCVCAVLDKHSDGCNQEGLQTLLRRFL